MLRLKHMALALAVLWGLMLLCQRHGCAGIPSLLSLPHQRAQEAAKATHTAASTAATADRMATWQTGPARWTWQDGDGSSAAAAAAGTRRFNASLSLVPFPRLIHMTWKTHRLPSWSMANYRSWEVHNPGWTIVVWDDEQVGGRREDFLRGYGCLSVKLTPAPPPLPTIVHLIPAVDSTWPHPQVDAFVKQHLPEILPWWKTALKPVQRADVFRYLVLRERGGVYADIDGEKATHVAASCSRVNN